MVEGHQIHTQTHTKMISWLLIHDKRFHEWLHGVMTLIKVFPLALSAIILLFYYCYFYSLKRNKLTEL